MSQEERLVSRRAFLRGTAGAAAVAGASGTAGAQDEGGGGGGDGGGNGGGGDGGGGGGGTQQVDVVNYAFNPGTEEPLEIKPGTQVKWVWKSDGHNIVVENKPDDSKWEGHEPLEDEGFEYTHTFETKGEYSYFCEPHKDLGMVADLTVTDSPTEKKEYETIVPDSAKTLGVAVTGAMAAVLGLTYFFMKYGGDYGEHR